MGNPNTQRAHAETFEYAKLAEIYKKAFDATDGTYAEKDKAAQDEVTKYRRTMLGEKMRTQLAQQFATLAPMPEAGESESELGKLSKEKVTAWLERYQGDLGNALVSMFNLDPKYIMTKDELALFTSELKDPNHVKQKTFFELSNWLNRVSRNNVTINVPEAAVVESILSRIAKNQSLAELRVQKAA